MPHPKWLSVGILQVAIVVLLDVLPSSAEAAPAVLYVSVTGSNTSCAHLSEPFATIQAAVDCADNGVTIIIGPGRFAGGVRVVHDLTLRGAGRKETTIAGGGSVISFVSLDSSLDGVTVRNGAAAGSGVQVLGSALRITKSDIRANNGIGIQNTGGVVTLAGSVVRGNDGGGIDNLGELTLRHSTIRDNTAGTSYGTAGITTLDTLRLRDSVISGNSGGETGGITSVGADVIIRDDSSVVNNSGAEVGGIDFVGSGSFVLVNSTVTGNTPLNCLNVAC